MPLPRPSRRCASVAAAALCLAGILSAGASTEEVAATPQLRDIFRALGSEDFTVREKAQQQLQTLATGEGAIALEQALDKYLATDDPEVKIRLRSAMYNAVAANAQRRGFIGISMDIFGRAPRDAVLVLNIIRGSAAEASGILPRDEIIKLDGQPFRGHDPAGQLKDYVTSKNQGDELSLTIRRRGEIIERTIKLGGMPDDLDPDFKEKAFDEWMHGELVERGLAEPRPEIMPGSQRPFPTPLPGVEPRFVPAPRIVPIPRENLFPE